MNELAIKDDDILGLAVSAADGTWTEGLESDLLRPKFAKLISHGSKALIPGSDTHIPGIASGDYAVSSDKINLGKKIRIVVCGTKKTYVERDSAPPDGKFVASHSPEDFAKIKGVLKQDEKNPGKWTDSSGGCFVETMTLFFLELDHLELGGLCMSFTSSGIKAWRDIVSRTQGAKVKTGSGAIVNLAPWAVVWTLASKTETPATGNPYLLPAIDGNFSIIDKALAPIAQAAFDQVLNAVKSNRVAVDETF